MAWKKFQPREPERKLFRFHPGERLEADSLSSVGTVETCGDGHVKFLMTSELEDLAQIPPGTMVRIIYRGYDLYTSEELPF